MKQSIIIKAYPVSSLFLKSLFLSFLNALPFFFLLVVIHYEFNTIGILKIILIVFLIFLVIQIFRSMVLILREKTKEIIIHENEVKIVRRGNAENIRFDWNDLDSVKEIENKLMMRTVLYLKNGKKITVLSADFDMINWEKWNTALIQQKNMTLRILDR